VSPRDRDLVSGIDELSNALQTALLLAGQLATGLRADAHDADSLYVAITRATAVLQRLKPDGDER
jgi:hypothetical protein